MLGHQTQSGGANLFSQFFSKNNMKMKEIWTPRVRVPGISFGSAIVVYIYVRGERKYR